MLFTPSNWQILRKRRRCKTGGGHNSEVKLLVVEDEPTAIAFLSQGLREDGYFVDTATTSLEAAQAVAINSYDVILLDVMIPGKSGFDLCHEWKQGGLTTPILFLTARGEMEDRIKGLDFGADDYLVKPYEFAELLARIRVLLRRSNGSSGGSTLRFGDLEIDLRQRVVHLQSQPLKLTAKEFQILEFFALRPSQLVTRTMLWEHVWETNAVPDSNVVDVYVRYLRNKLGRDPEYITTRRGEGYVFSTPPGTS